MTVGRATMLKSIAAETKNLSATLSANVLVAVSHKTCLTAICLDRDPR